MKKKSLFMALAALFVLAFASCNNEPEITGPGIDDGDDKPQPTEGIFSWEFSTSFGEFTTQNVLGDESWKIDFKTAYMSGYIKDTKENRANEDWLISPSIKLENVTSAKLKMEYAAKFFASLSTDITVWVSENYTEGVPSTAQWTEVKPAGALVEVPDWNTFTTTEYSLTPYVGKTIRFAIKYVSNDTKAGTIEVKSVKVEEGEASGSGNTDNDKENALTVSEAIAKQDQSIMWVKGYIVAGVDTAQSANFIKDPSSVIFATKGIRPTAIVIAETKEETDYTKCLVIGFGSDSNEAKAALNLVDNPSNLGKEVFLKGKLMNAFGVPGMKTITEFDLEGYVAPAQKSFVLVSDDNITAGSYCFAANVDGVYKVMKALAASYNYGYAMAVDGDYADNVLKADETCVFTVSETDGGFTIKDCYNKYYYMQGTYNSFNVSANLPAEGAVWTFSKSSDATYSVMNVSNNKTLQYSVDHSSYGIYPDERGVAPLLFKLVE